MEVILCLAELFALKDLVGVGLFNFVSQYSEKRLVSPGLGVSSHKPFLRPHPSRAGRIALSGLTLLRGQLVL